MSKLNDKIREFREEIGQSIEGLALLMQMQPEEYARLEEDRIPSDDVLQKMCALFEWNYQEIKRLADQTPSANRTSTAIHSELPSLSGDSESGASVVENRGPKSLGQMLQESRTAVGQTPEGIATLLGVPVDYYLEFEAGATPPDDLLRKLCSLFSWNYKQIRQKIITKSSGVLGTRQPPLPAKEIQSRIPKTELPELPEISAPVALSEQILQARTEAGQNVEGISLLLQINPEYYEQIESGKLTPEPDLLKRISALFGWNYHELLTREKSSQLSRMQPAVTSLDVSASSLTERKLWKIQEEIATDWKEISQEQQESLLTQLELIRDTMERWKNIGANARQADKKEVAPLRKNGAKTKKQSYSKVIEGTEGSEP